MEEFIEELKHNREVNIEKGLENRVDIDYVIERLESEEDKLKNILNYINDIIDNNDEVDVYTLFEIKDMINDKEDKERSFNKYIKPYITNEKD